MSPSPTNSADFVNHHPGIEHLESGKWLAKIQHPISKVWVLLGIYTTLEEAKDAYTRKKLDYESSSVHKSASSYFHTNVTDFEKHRGVKHMKSGKWTAQISHNHESIWLGSYTTPKEAAEAYILSKLELNSQKTGCLIRGSSTGSIYRVSKGKWKAEIEREKVRYYLGIYATVEDAEEAINRKRCELGLKADIEKTPFSQQTEKENQITNAGAHLGTLDTAHEAYEAYNNMMREFDITVHAHKKSRCEDDAKAQGKSDSPCVSDVLFVRTDRSLGIEAYNNMMRDFDMVVHAHKKSRCEDDAIAQGTCDSACVSNELFVPADGSSGIEAIKEEEIGDSMINVNVESVPIYVTETEREFDSGIVDSYGQLVGEYSRLDDDLWLCRYEDDATLGHDEDHSC